MHFTITFATLTHCLYELNAAFPRIFLRICRFKSFKRRQTLKAFLF